MIVFIVIAILGFIIGIVAANFLFWFVSYIISSFFALFFGKNKKVTQGLIQTVLLFITTLFLFIYSFKSCTYVDRFGGNSDSMPVIGGWFLFLTGLICGCVTFFVFGLSFDESEEQKPFEDEKNNKSSKQLAREEFSERIEETPIFDYNTPKETSESFIESLNKKELSRIRSLTPSINSNDLEENISELETEFYEVAKNKGVNFLKSPEYVFLQKAVIRERKDGFVNYDLLNSQIRHKWKFSKDQLYKFASIERKEQNLGRSFLQEQNNKESNFTNSSAYKYIKQFAKKYGEKGKAEDFNQLQTLLKNWQYDFSTEELKSLVVEESKKQKIENLKTKILSDNPHNRGAILKAYLNFYRSNDEINLKVLAELLEERYSVSEDILNLKSELRTIEKRIELENFEKRLLEEDEQIQLAEIDSLNGYEFEDFLKVLFSKMGYQVEQTKLSGDQGADLVVIKFGEKSIIQAKRFGGKVGNKAVQEILAAISLYQAQKGMVITNSYFTPSAFELANANNIELIDRDALEELINKHW